MVSESTRRRLAAVFAVALFLGGLFAIDTAQANPAVPYCEGSVAPSPEAPMVIMPEVCEAATGRVFPEAFAHPSYAEDPNYAPYATGFADDFVGYFEFQAGLEYLAAQYPDYITIHEVAQSAGLCPVTKDPQTGECPLERVSLPIYMLEITNENSPMPLEERQSVLFMLSIHGNEKGGREGGFRVLEDLLKGIGFAAETVQNGAGLPDPIPRLDGEGEVQTYQDYLDFMRVFLLFPNADGWAHDEAPYVSDPYCVAGPGFCRTNGNNVDLNRQAPTLGWQNPSRNVIGEPEAIGYYNWMLTNDIDWSYAIDIHGMLMHQNFAAIMLPAGSMTPQEMQRSRGLAETLKERLNDNPHFAAWESTFAAQQTVWGDSDLCGEVDCPGQTSALGGNPAHTVGSPTFAEYYTVIDAIGYTDSGFNGDYFAQNTGLNAPGYDIELAYNHITVDSQYEGLGAQINDYHVKIVREIVKSFMDSAALDVKISFETGGSRTLYLESPVTATNLDDDDPTPGPDSWAVANPGDDLWEYGLDNPFFARPAKYWEDLKPYVRDGDQPGVLARTTVDKVSAGLLEDYDTFIIAGSAIKELENETGRIQAVLDWVEEGGNLILTDEGLRYLDMAGVTDDAVDVVQRYMGGIKMDLNNDGYVDDHPMLAKLNDGVMQMYEPTPLGFGTTGTAPNWFVDVDAVAAAGGEVVGLECGLTTLNTPQCDGNGAGLGQIPVGTGMIQFMGSLVPDPSEEFYHPYSLDDYATTYSANQIVRNMLGWDEIFAAPPVVIQDGTIIQTPNEQAPANDDAVSEGADDEGGKRGIPGLGVVAVLGTLALLGAAMRRR